MIFNGTVFFCLLSFLLPNLSPPNAQNPWKNIMFFFPFLVGCLVGLLLPQQPQQQPTQNKQKNQTKKTKTKGRVRLLWGPLASTARSQQKSTKKQKNQNKHVLPKYFQEVSHYFRRVGHYFSGYFVTTFRDSVISLGKLVTLFGELITIFHLERSFRKFWPVWPPWL